MKKITLCIPVLLFSITTSFAQKGERITLNKGQSYIVEGRGNQPLRGIGPRGPEVKRKVCG